LEQVVAINRNDWSSSIGTGGRHQSVRAIERNIGQNNSNRGKDLRRRTQ